MPADAVAITGGSICVCSLVARRNAAAPPSLIGSFRPSVRRTGKDFGPASGGYGWAAQLSAERARLREKWPCGWHPNRTRRAVRRAGIGRRRDCPDWRKSSTGRGEFDEVDG